MQWGLRAPNAYGRARRPVTKCATSLNPGVEACPGVTSESMKASSSAVIFTYLLQDNHLATVVGQSPSNNPNSYGDVIPLRLPNSRLRWIMTYKYFERANGDNDPATPLAPDIVTAPGAELDAVAADS